MSKTRSMSACRHFGGGVAVIKKEEVNDGVNRTVEDIADGEGGVDYVFS